MESYKRGQISNEQKVINSMKKKNQEKNKNAKFQSSEEKKKE